MITCPNCHRDTTIHSLPGHGAMRPLVVESCGPCNLFWFDRTESVRLKPEAVIELFKYIGTIGKDTTRNPLALTFSCPRCGLGLTFTHDVQRTTHFTYWRCEGDHGQLITFAQFLREKNFIR